MMAAEKLASAELGMHALSEVWAYWHGQLDEWTLLEDALSAACTVSAFKLAPHLLKVIVGGASPSVMDVLGRQVLLHTTGETLCEVLASAASGVISKSMESLCGSREARALRCAYGCLGLSSKGIGEYTLSRIESQLEFSLRHGGDAILLCSAYEFIRARHHPHLRHPFLIACPDAAKRDSNNHGFEEDCSWLVVPGKKSRAASLAVLNLDPLVEHSQESIRRRFLELCLLHHPDKPSGNHDVYLKVRGAYEMLMEEH